MWLLGEWIPCDLVTYMYEHTRTHKERKGFWAFWGKQGNQFKPVKEQPTSPGLQTYCFCHAQNMVLTFLWHGKVWSEAWSFRFLIIDFGVAYLTGRTKMNKLAPDWCAALPELIKSNPLPRLYKKEQSKSSWYLYSWFLATIWRANDQG